MTEYDPSWIDLLETVTPDDIKRAHQEALDAGWSDTKQLQAYLRAALAQYGGYEGLARKWTRRNRLAAYRAAYRRGPSPQVPAVPLDAKDLLRELIERFPKEAREALAGDDEAGEPEVPPA